MFKWKQLRTGSNSLLGKEELVVSGTVLLVHDEARKVVRSFGKLQNSGKFLQFAYVKSQHNRT